jgi:hypothetical protein
MRKTLFEIAVLLHPDDDSNESTQILVNPTYILASDTNAATILAAREIPEDCLDKLDRVEVAVRPF